METVVRKDADTIAVTKPGWNGTEVIDVTNEYKLDFLTKQLETIQDQKAREIEQRDKEIDNVNTLLGYFDTYPLIETEPII